MDGSCLIVTAIILLIGTIGTGLVTMNYFSKSIEERRIDIHRKRRQIMFKDFLRKIFKIHSPSKEWVNIHKEYLEYDTECDLCDRKSECELMNVTRVADTRTHVLNAFGFSCPLESEEKE